MSKQASKQATTTTPTPVVPIPTGTPVVPWSVKGRGQSATYCAGLPVGQGASGTSVALVAQSGAVTFGTLTEIRETGDGIARWDFARDAARMTAEVKRANRAAKSAATAAYWSSDAGLETARRIDQRAATKTAPAAPAAPVAPVAPVASVAPTAPVASVDADLVAATVAALIAAGATAEVIAATVAAFGSSAGTVAAFNAPGEPVATVAGKGRTVLDAATAHDVAERCDACNRDRKGCQPHRGAAELLVCPRCASLDSDTARTRAARHG